MRNSEGGHVPALDGVRGLSIVLVLVAHLIGLPLLDVKDASAAVITLRHAAGYGLFGVDLFFVLSGFLITGILWDSKRSKGYLRNFYMRRVLRIFPLHYASLVVLLFIAPLFLPNLREDIAPTFACQGWAWLYAVNIRNGIYGNLTMKYVDHYWSLAVEEHFYFVWPFVVRALSTRRLQSVAVWVALASVAASVVGALLKANPVALHVLTPFRLDLLCLGALFAVKLRNEGPNSVGTVSQSLALVGGVGAVYSFVAQVTTPAWTELARQGRAVAIHLLLAALLAYVVSVREPGRIVRFFESRAMRFLGRYSYGIYIIHGSLNVYLMGQGWPAKMALKLHSGLAGVLAYAVVSGALSIALAVVSFRVLETPFLNMKRRFASEG